jgi:hypothetical protein
VCSTYLLSDKQVSACGRNSFIQTGIAHFVWVSACVLCLWQAVSAWDGFFSPGYASSGAAYLDMPGHAASSALGGAVTAWREGLTGVQYNPAIYDAADGLNIIGTYGMYPADGDGRQFIPLDIALPLEKIAVLGLSFSRLSLDGFEHRDDYGMQLGTFKDIEQNFALSVAGRLKWNLAVGLRARYLSQKFTTIADGTANGMGFDAGITWQPDPRICVGASGLNLGSRLYWKTGQKDKVLPQARIGVAGFLLKRQLALSADFAKRDGQPLETMAGIQYNFLGLIYARGGISTSIDYREMHLRDPDISFGMGIRYAFFGCDYAMIVLTQPDIVSHRVSLVLKFALPQVNL